MRHIYTKELLEPFIRNSKSWAKVCRELGIKPATGSQTHIKKVAVLYGIDFSHFTGQGWRRDKTFTPKRKIEYFLAKDGPFINSHHLKKRLISEGMLPGNCEICGLSEWMRQELPLELDHLNNNHSDNRLENLMILCPNCHALKTRRERKLRKK